MPGTSLLPVLGASAAAIFGLMAMAWLWSVNRKDVGVIDIFWGLGFVIVAGIAYVMGEAGGPRRLLIVAMVAVWGLRLSGFLFWRNVIAHLYAGGEKLLKEDRRYGAMRNKHGDRFWWVSIVTVFGLQGVLLFVISLPATVVQTIPGHTDIGALDYIGIALFAVGLFFETVGDIQLANFRLNPGSHGQVLNTGLWRFTRHPNYFGDCAAWWGIFLVAAGSGTAMLGTAVGPLLLTILLLKVSGVALTEKGMTGRRPAYAKYIETTSAFLPWFPKRVKREAVPHRSARQAEPVRAK